MGNAMGGRRKAKVMKIDGETFKLKTPVRAWDVVKDYPDHVLLDSEAVKHFGIRAKPLEPQQELKPRKIYFLVQMPKLPSPEEKVPRRVRSGVHMSAKDRLECLMLSRRTVSDLATVRPSSEAAAYSENRSTQSGPLQVKMRLPRVQVAKLMEESKDDADVAEKILSLCIGGDGDLRQGQGKPNFGTIGRTHKAREKQVSFVPVEEGEICLDVSAQ